MQASYDLLRAERACPGCRVRIRLPEGKSGTVRCPKCEFRFHADTRVNDRGDAGPSGIPRGIPREIRIRQNTREWLDLRMTLRMASETPAILGLSPYQKADDIRAAKQGARGFRNNAMRKGADQEPIARAAYAAAVESVRPAFFVSGSYGCSLDGINADGSIVVEIKTPYRGRDSDRWRLAAQGQAAGHDVAQIQHQLMVCGAARAHLWVWDAGSREGKLVEIAPEPGYWSRITSAWDAFWPTLSR